jgi:hypothetical protein
MLILYRYKQARRSSNEIAAAMAHFKGPLLATVGSGGHVRLPQAAPSAGSMGERRAGRGAARRALRLAWARTPAIAGNAG